jgi:hypothetical protein
MMEMLAALQASPLSTWVREASTIWAYPTVLTLHTIGLGVLVGVNAAVDLRVLGFGTRIPLEPMEKFFPAMWAGFWVNAVTGFLLFAADPIEKGTTVLFAIKLGLVVAGVVLMVALRRALYRKTAERPLSVSHPAKAFAAASLFVWVTATAAGRMMAYW